MPFSNLTIDIDSLPKQEDVTLHPVSKKFKAVQWWNWSILWLIVAALFIGFLFLPKVNYTNTTIILISSALLLVAIVHRLMQQLSFRFRAFALREQDIIYQQGWLIRKKEICPLSRVQHCSVNASVIERKYGLATLELFTAGSNGADITIRGLTAQQAAMLKEVIIQKTGNDQ